MPDYSKGKIYCVRSSHTDEVYIGSTISTLSKRMGQHREKFNKWKKGEHHYITCFKLLDLGDAYIELIEEHPCENKNQLERREGEIMRQTENCVNKMIAGRTSKEYYEENKEILLKKQAEYKHKHLETFLERRKQVCKKYRETHKEQEKLYRQEYERNNREKINARKRLRRQEKKEQEKINDNIIDGEAHI